MSLDSITRVDGQATTGAGAPENDEETPARIGRFFVFRQLGEGGMGRVFLGYDEELDRKLAIKLWHGRGDHTVRVRMLREAQALARLAHPHIITVYEVGEENGRVFLAMEYVEGETLRGWVQAQPRPVSAILARYLQAGSGLAAAHRAGILHRDFKPDNAIAGADDRVRVLDFGLARAEQSLLAEESLSGEPVLRISNAGGVLDAPMTVVGTVLGTPAYMPPEQLAGQATDARSDIFSFCVALWEALYGVRPFRAETIKELTTQILTAEPDEGADAKVPRRLRAALVRGLAAEPDDRWQTMDDLLLALTRSSRRLRWLPAVAVAVSATILGASIFGYSIWRDERQVAACGDAAQAIEAVWNGAVQADLRATAAATQLDYATASVALLGPVLHRYVGSWRAAAVDVCERSLVDQEWATHFATEARACLEERSWALEALVVELSHANLARLQHALPAALALPAIDRCLDPVWLQQRPRPPSDPESRIEIDAIRESLERTRSLEALGNIDEALRIAETLVERSDALGWKPLRARARLLAGRLSEEQAIEDAAEYHESGFFTALDADEDALAAQLATRLVVAIGVDLSRPEEGALWGRWAHALIARQPAGQEMGFAALDGQLGILAHAQGKLDEAEAAWRRSLAIQESILGPHHPNVARLLNNIGTLHHLRGDADEAAALWQRSLAIWEASLGPNHPTTAAVHVNLGLIQLEQGDYAQALASTERALAIWEQAFGPNHAKLVTALLNIGEIRAKMGAPRPGLAAFQRALAIAERTFGDEHHTLITLLLSSAKLRAQLGDIQAAAVDLERTRAIAVLSDDPGQVADADLQLALLYLEIDGERSDVRLSQALTGLKEVYGSASDEVIDALVTVAQAHLKGDRAPAAIPLLEQVVAIADARPLAAPTDADEAEPANRERVADARFALAKALYTLAPTDATEHVDSPRQRVELLAAQAEATYRRLNATEPLETLRAWRASVIDDADPQPAPNVHIPAP